MKISILDRLHVASPAAPVKVIWRGVPRHGLLSVPVAACLVAAVLVLFGQHRYMPLAIPVAVFTVFAISSPRIATLSLLPLGMLISIAFEWGLAGELDVSQVTAAIVAVCVGIVAGGMALWWLSGRVHLTAEHIPVATLGALVLAGYLAPPVVVARWTAVNSLVDSRHFPGLLVCLLMFSLAIVAAPKPAHVLHAFIWSSVAVAVFAFSRGLYGGNNRLYTEVYYSTWLGIIEGPAVVACVGLAYARRTMLWLAPAAICLSCVIASGARTGMLAALVGVMFVLATGRTGLRRLTLLYLCGAVAILVIWYGASVQDLLAPMRDGSSIDSSDVHRAGIMLSSLELIVENPLRGIGYGNLSQLIDISFGPRTGAHNDYIRLAAENGLPALALFLFVVIRGIWARRHGDLGVVRAVVVSCLVWIGTDVALPHPVISVHFWIPLACLLAVRGKKDEAGPDASRP